MRTIPIEDRFWQKVNKTDSCWLWTGVKGRDGYGKIMTSLPEKKTLRAHRYSYVLHKGNIPEGLWICHTCDNPACVNPEHLYAGTPTDNNRDTVARNRINPAKGASHWSRKNPQIRDAIGRFHKLKSSR